MSKKPASKPTSSGAQPPTDTARSKTPLIASAVVLVAVIVGALALMRSSSPSASPEASVAAAARPAEPAPSGPLALKPHPQTSFPPLPWPEYTPPRPREVISDVYRFAAEHPEILTYVPCFCGCERGGHKGNEDCFVKSRGANGDVVAWEEHGMECAVCIDVGHQAMQMFATGASPKDIRVAVEKRFAGQAMSHTPTPMPPGHQH